MIGNYALSAGYYDAYYLKALKVRTLIQKDYTDAFEKVDVIAAPTAPTPAYKIGEMISDPLKMYLQDICTVPLNLAGLPGISVPCGYSQKHMPIGLQLIGKPLDEATLIRTAYTYEQSQSFHKEMAELGGAEA
jgi:aspartyl-tRNA(Asn)/glutamyl-tRNA(Gln) amidotransferase subunit A